MARDFLTDENGDLVIDEDTHDFAWVTGVEEVAQRIRATLLIRYGEMVNLAPDQGADYSNFLGKNFNAELAAADMTTAIEDNVPEVETVTKINFTKLPHRRLLVSFQATVNLDDDNEQTVEGDVNIANN